MSVCIQRNYFYDGILSLNLEETYYILDPGKYECTPRCTCQLHYGGVA